MGRNVEQGPLLTKVATIAVDLGALALAAFLTLQVFSRLDTNRPRTSAQQTEKAKELAAKARTMPPEPHTFGSRWFHFTPDPVHCGFCFQTPF